MFRAQQQILCKLICVLRKEVDEKKQLLVYMIKLLLIFD